MNTANVLIIKKKKKTNTHIIPNRRIESPNYNL